MQKSHESLLPHQGISPRSSDIIHEKWLNTLGFPGYRGTKLLDLGCGSGYFLDLASRAGALSCTGVDIVPPPELGGKQPWEFLQVDLDSSQWAKDLGQGPFDTIFAFDIIEHLNSPVIFLEQCHKLLETGGQLYLTTPNTQSLERFRNPRHWSGALDPQHRILFSKYSLRFLLERTHFKVQILKAPLRSLGFLPKACQWNIGGQLLIKALKIPTRPVI